MPERSPPGRTSEPSPTNGLDLDRFFDLMPDGAAVCELQFDAAGRPTDCRLLRANPAFWAVLCSRPGEVAGRTACELIPGLEDRIEHAGRCMSITALRVTDQRVAVLLRDETERQQAKEALAANRIRLELALDSASIGVYEWDLVTGEHRWDDRIWVHLGLPSGAPLSFERFIGAIHPDNRGALQAGIAEELIPPDRRSRLP